MSEIKLISPLLDNFRMGDPISCHDGVRCCPAMENGSDNKYIVKVISVPASQVQLDALLLTGAYKSAKDADAYFNDIAAQVCDEAAILNKLSSLEGFISYEKWQTVPMEHGTGYNVYLLGEYRRTLDQHLKKNAMTHLGALNLGLDLCAAMAVCRHAGYLYIDLKPGNVCIEENKGYRIFDLGFIKLNGLKYASMPDKYYSQYTAPEIADAFSSLNATIDIYAIGMILYQVYNGGALPFKGTRAPAEVLPPPAYADYEMAEIILKACAPDPKDRWSDPIQMGQALVNYMQRNGANDVPIIPVAPSVDPFEEYAHAETSVEASSELPEVLDTDASETDDLCQESLFDHPEVSEISDTADDTIANTEETPLEEAVVAAEIPVNSVISADVADDAPLTECIAGNPDDTADVIESVSDLLQTEQPAASDDAIIEGTPNEENEDISSEIPVTSESPANDSPWEDEIPESEDSIENLAFLNHLTNDETAPDTADSSEDYGTVTEEVSEILSYADELLAHPIPEPVVAPDPIEVPIPDPIVLQEEPPVHDAEKEEDVPLPVEEEALVIPEFNNASAVENSFPAPTDLSNDPQDIYLDGQASNGSSLKKWIVAILLLLLTAAIAFFGFYYYQNYYLQPVSINPSGSDDSLVVYVTSSISEDKLTVLCVDTYGNSIPSPVIDGKAVFTDLVPGSGYTISVEVEGFHRLTGNTSTAYSTPVQTNVVQFTAIAGPEDGSVILSFAIDGPDSQQWSVRYTADGEPSKAQPFSGHMVTVVGLTVGKEYTFTLESENSVYIAGNHQLVWLAEKNILAENLEITGCDSNKLTATWNAPEGTTVETWSVRCYNENGFDETVKTETTSVVFDNIDHTKGYTLEVTAANMTVSSRTFISANSVTVSNFKADCSNPEKLLLTWDTTHPLASGNWILLYSADGLDIHEVTGTSDNWIEVKPIVPNATYTFTLMNSAGSHVFNNSLEYFVNQSPDFNNYNVTAANMEFNMCKTPDDPDWDRFDLKPEDYKTTFTVGERASFLIRVRNQYNPLSDNIVSMFVIRNKDGKIVNVATSEQTWINMWYKGYCELDIPVMPASPGEYTVTVYFNGYYAGERDFTVTNS